MVAKTSLFRNATMTAQPLNSVSESTILTVSDDAYSESKIMLKLLSQITSLLKLVMLESEQ
jgi:hypothetical protein